MPERRDRDGLALGVNIRDNISLPRLRERGRPWYVGRGWQRSSADDAVDVLDIRPRASTTLDKQLSGGNQHKALLGSGSRPVRSFLSCTNPTQAVDVGERRDLLHALRRAAEAGMAVILVAASPRTSSPPATGCSCTARARTSPSCRSTRSIG